MRVLVRPLVLFAILATFSAAVESQEGSGQFGGQGGADSGTNLLLFASGSPAATTGGVTVSLTIQPTTSYTCTSVTIYILDQDSNTLASTTINNPGATATQTFSGLGSGVTVTVQVDSVFQSGAQFDSPYLETTVTTN
jgi:hypothetical protein